MGLFGKLIKSAINLVEAPIAVIKDVATLGGTLIDQKRTYTEQKLDELGETWDETKEEIEKL